MSLSHDIDKKSMYIRSPLSLHAADILPDFHPAQNDRPLHPFIFVYIVFLHSTVKHQVFPVFFYIAQGA